MADAMLGPDDEPQYSGAVIAVNYGDGSAQESRRRARGRRGARSDRAEQRFRDFLQKVGADLLEDQWLGVMYKHRVRCSEGHEGEVVPNALDRPGRRNVCLVCARQDSATAEAAFREGVAGLGGTVLEPTWLGSIRPHRVRCAAGHESTPIPGNVARGQGICGACAGNDPDEARRQFYERIAKHGATVEDGFWRGVDGLHAVRCIRGHSAQVRPMTLRKGMQNLCDTCAGRTPEAMDAKFRARIGELGGEVLEPGWLGVNKGHRVRCKAGHVTSPKPKHILSGTGMCRTCAGRSWDVFYVVTSPETSILKFGITSGNPRPRLTDHAHDGFRYVDLVLAELGNGTALSVERAVRSSLRAAGHRPVRGLEYFSISVREFVFTTAADVLARGPVTLLTAGDQESYRAGWRNGRRRMVEQMETVADDDE